MPNDNQYLCHHCRKTFTPRTKPKRDFLGFTKVVCPKCNLESKYPLSAAYSTIYFLMLLGNVGHLFYGLSRGERLTLNPFGLIVLAFVATGLAQNARLKREIENIKRTPPGKPSTDFAIYKRIMIAKDPAYASMSDRELKPGYQNWLAAQQADAAVDVTPKA